MAKSLIIVESPAKANTIKKYLGKDFIIKASIGHLIDLPKSELGVDTKDNFKPTYVTIKGKNKILKELQDAAKTVEQIYIAPDPDREGEAIAWHIANKLKKKTNVKIYRVLFNEITKKAVVDAVKNPKEIDLNRVDAQQTRRILDRLVGYKISPILWKKVKRGLSAGRVQSIAMRVIWEREKEINAFKIEEYWSVKAKLEGKTPPEFMASLLNVSGKKIKIENNEQAQNILDELKSSPFNVKKVQKKERKRNPTPPFITSSLQQEASRRFRYSAKKTMMIAQKLYEGLEIGEDGAVGLITYMRTDSTRVSDEALVEVRDLISKNYGKNFLPQKPNVYKTKKSAQDAHEAIRPTSSLRDPKSLSHVLSKEELNLYDLIWKRFVSSQIKPAILDTTSIDIESGKYLFRATGSIIKFMGFMQVYTETKEGTLDPAKSESSKEADSILPEIKEGEELKLADLQKNQHFTQPPPRYTEASLIKELEDKGIGRPSTYAQIMSVIRDRDYVIEEERKFKPSELGILITELLIESFPRIMDVKFTAHMETELDDIEEGKRTLTEILTEFYKPFEANIKKAETQMKNVKAEIVETDIDCEKCGAKMGVRWGKFGKFLACMNYPECKNTKQLKPSGEGKIEIEEEEKTDEICEKCGENLIVKTSKFGKFLSCSKYPDCKFTKSMSTGVDCPECGDYIGVRYSKRGKVFYGCSKYPKCTFALWNKPIKETCPDCKAPVLTEKINKNGAKAITCSKKECKYKRFEKKEI